VNLRLHQAEQLNGCAALELAVEGWRQLLIKKTASAGLVLLHWDDRVIWFEHKREVIAVMTYRVMDWNKTIWIGLSFVCPQWRKRGLYRRMYRALRVIAAKKGIAAIESGISPTNKVMIAAAQRCGRTLSHLVYRDGLEAPQR
jgi:GNAT superfamily N-acetyltransferase